MDEEQKEEGKEEEQEVSTPGEEEGVQSETDVESKIDRANAAAQRLEEANRKHEELLAENALGGGSYGNNESEVKKELTPKEYADEVMKGNIPKKE